VVVAYDDGTMLIARFDLSGHLDGSFGAGEASTAAFPKASSASHRSPCSPMAKS
jgi:hypothetical protein